MGPEWDDDCTEHSTGPPCLGHSSCLEPNLTQRPVPLSRVSSVQLDLGIFFLVKGFCCCCCCCCFRVEGFKYNMFSSCVFFFSCTWPFWHPDIGNLSYLIFFLERSLPATSVLSPWMGCSLGLQCSFNPGNCPSVPPKELTLPFLFCVACGLLFLGLLPGFDGACLSVASWNVM